ncbi:unnamed protein product, partial [marine sediment metagenome]
YEVSALQMGQVNSPSLLNFSSNQPLIQTL